MEYPEIRWEEGDVMVIDKPSGWVCSASDIDKKAGRKLDPDLKPANKGFYSLQDLMDYEFAEREKRYVHWWTQLCLYDEDTYPIVFDEDQNYGQCQRIDRETSGGLLIGLTPASREQLRTCFHRRFVRDLHVCLVHGRVEPASFTIDRCIETCGSKARLSETNGKRARTRVEVLGYFSHQESDGSRGSYTLCTCEGAENRMHQSRIHMAVAYEAPLVSEFYYQKKHQLDQDRRWCPRIFMHKYAMSFPEVSSDFYRIASNEKDHNRAGKQVIVVEDDQQKWHCCISPLPAQLREAMRVLEPTDQQSERLLECILDRGMIDDRHETFHAVGTQAREESIDSVFFPFQRQMNPIQAGDLARTRSPARPQPPDSEEQYTHSGTQPEGKQQKLKGKGRGSEGGGPAPRVPPTPPPAPPACDPKHSMKGKYCVQLEKLPEDLSWQDLKDMGVQLAQDGQCTFARTCGDRSGLLEFTHAKDMERAILDFDGRFFSGDECVKARAVPVNGDTQSAPCQAPRPGLPRPHRDGRQGSKSLPRARAPRADRFAGQSRPHPSGHGRPRSPLPRERRPRSPLPREGRSRSPLPRERMFRSPLPREGRSRSPLPRERRSRSPLLRDRRTSLPLRQMQTHP